VLENRYWECDYCDFYSVCNPFLIEGINVGSAVAVFDLDGVVFDDVQKVKLVLKSMEMPQRIDPEDLRGSLREQFLQLYLGEAFFDHDRPSAAVINILEKEHKAGVSTILISDRFVTTRDVTISQLKAFKISYDALLLRPNEGARTFSWKQEMLDRLKGIYQIKFFMDDSSLVRKEIGRRGIKAIPPTSTPD